MAVTKIDVDAFISLSKNHLIIDVRSEGEYQHAHIPSATSLPLFTNEERKIVGTAYKQQSREIAIKIGMDFFGKKMRTMVEQVERLALERSASQAKSSAKQPGIFNSKSVLIHCWRGGMRSGAVAWLLDLYGFKVYTLVGGYKAFRNWAIKKFEKDYPFKILGGYTGSGKTYVLTELKKRGQRIIDLEQLANHKGSAFGNVGVQPTQEMFENLLAVELDKCIDVDETEAGIGKEIFDEKEVDKQTKTSQTVMPDVVPSSTINCTHVWLEDESQRIGQVNIPVQLWQTMRKKPVYFLDINFEERLDHIVKEYGKEEKEKLVNATIRIQKRLGGLETKTAVNYLLENDVRECFRILLKYYDKLYFKGLNSREGEEMLITKITCNKVDAKENTTNLLQQLN